MRGNGKIIQELETIFRGSGWNVIKVIWGREWDDLLAKDRDGVLVEKMNTTVDGEFQKYAPPRPGTFDQARVNAAYARRCSSRSIFALRVSSHGHTAPPSTLG